MVIKGFVQISENPGHVTALFRVLFSELPCHKDDISGAADFFFYVATLRLRETVFCQIFKY